MQKPNIFFLGGAKCGTTALASYLGEHSQVQVATPKEPHYFCKDLKAGGIPVTSDEGYVARFFPGLEKTSVLCAVDTSVWYLYSEVALKNILCFNPEAKFIVFLRNPARMAYSLHSMFHFQGQEDQSDILRAWELQEARKHGRNLPRGLWLDPAMLQYRAVCSLGSQLERVLQMVDRARVHVVFQEELSRNTVEEYEHVLQFIGVPSEGKVEFPKLNSGRKFDNKLVVHLLRSNAAIKIAALIKSALGLKTLGIGRPELPMSDEVFAFLTAEFEGEVRKLEKMLDKDLSGWHSRCNLKMH